jgi:hypothetical protein
MARRWWLIVGLALVLPVAAVSAHEIGTTRVTLDLRDNETFAAEVVTDAAALVTKLESAAGTRVPGDPASTLRALESTFRSRVVVAFDEVPVSPLSVTFAVTEPDDLLTPAVATIRVTGRRPSDARAVTWSYGWTGVSYPLSTRQAGDREPAAQWIEGASPSEPIRLAAREAGLGAWRIAVRYVGLGFTHIVPGGLDHVLFVLGVFLLSRRAKQVLWQVTAFTVAHSVTLALSVYDLVSVPPAIVEPLIAISIGWVAIENIFMSNRTGRRVALVFAFGLLHGLGFAGVLGEVGLPREASAAALLGFNVGVEAGQLAVIGAAFVLVGWWCATRTWYRRVVVVPASAVMALVAIYWTVERLSGAWRTL